MSADFQRVVTGHDADGNAVILSAAPPTKVQSLGPHGPVFYELWNTRETPAMIDRQSGEPEEEGLILAPPKNGTRLRILDILPETEDLKDLSADDARAHFEMIGAGEASAMAKGDAPHPFMHRTETIDYGIVLEGELTLILDKGEITVRKGDVIVQRGTNHAWANRSAEVCRIVFILIDGKFSDGL